MENATNFRGKWEKRWHPLWQEWVVYAAHRNSRPWLGEDLGHSTEEEVAYDPTCYLCPGNPRIHGARNPEYKDIFIFDNDHPVVGLNAPEPSPNPETAHIYHKEKATGIARVVCFDPRHHISLADVSAEAIFKVFKALQGQMQELSTHKEVHSVLIFENKGKAVGVSNPHPHCQIYAVDFPLLLVQKEIKAMQEYGAKHPGRNIFSDIISAELADGQRVLDEGPHAFSFIPFFARYAYECMVFPKKRHATLLTMSDEELQDFALVFQSFVRRLDMLLGIGAPYVMSFFQAPLKGYWPDYHMHLLIQPPWRQPGLLKYLAGPEIGAGNFMADTMPEDKAAELKTLNPEKYPAKS